MFSLYSDTLVELATVSAI